MKYAMYENYKPSGVEWLGEVPIHWTVKAIKWESPVLRGASPRPIDDPIYFDDDGEYAWVRISDVTEAGAYLEQTEQKLSLVGAHLSVKLKPGDLFLSIAGSVGKPCITRIKCCIHDGFVYFPRWKTDFKFLYYLFVSGEPYKGLGKMGTQLNLNTDTVGSIVIGLPDGDEQQTIARFLDAKTAQIDDLIAKKRQLIDKLKEKRSALIARTVTRGLPPEAAKAAGLEPNPEMKPLFSSWIDECPSHWQTWKISHGFEIIGSGTTPPSDNDDWYEGDIPWVTTGELRENIILDTRKKVNQAAFKEFSALKVFSKGALAIAMYGATIGRLGIFGVPATTNQACCVMADGIAFDNKFVFYWLQAFRDQIVMLATGGGQPNISQEKIRSLRIPCPDVLEQRHIVAHLQVETEKIDRLVDAAEYAIERISEYRQALITSAVTGKIDVRGLV